MDQQTGSKSGKEYVKAVYCHPAYLTSMQSTSWETVGWKKHKLELRLPREISITSDVQMTPPLWQKVKTNWRASWWKWRKVKVKVKLLSRVWLFATPWTIAYQAPPSMGFSRQEYWSGLPFPSPEDLPNPGIEPRSPHCRQTLYRKWRRRVKKLA